MYHQIHVHSGVDLAFYLSDILSFRTIASPMGKLNSQVMLVNPVVALSDVDTARGLVPV